MEYIVNIIVLKLILHSNSTLHMVVYHASFVVNESYIWYVEHSGIFQYWKYAIGNMQDIWCIPAELTKVVHIEKKFCTSLVWVS